MKMCLYNSAGCLAIDWAVDELELDSQEGQTHCILLGLTHCVRLTQPPAKRILRAILPGVKPQLGNKAEHSLLSSTKVKNA
jgi:hypothetical protein